MQKIFEHIDARLDESIAQLTDFVRIPSISAGAEGDTAASIGQAADFLLAQFEGMGFSAQKVQVSADTNPLVLAQSPGFSNDRPTVMVYGHYDVQGVDNPRAAWDVDPFAAVVRDDYLIARGASDNKGPTFAHIKAVEAILQSGAELPVDLLFVIEGEEECGSRALGAFIEQGGLDEYGPFLCTVISDTSMYGPDRPSLTLGLRGIVYFEVAVHGPKQDVHSGLFGGIVHNPNQVLLQALAGLFDAEGHIAVPGFYDGITPLSAREKDLYAALEAKEEDYCRELGVEALKSENGYSLLEQRWTRPTLEINHLSGGSPRTVIPAVAHAAISARLVPGQGPEKVQAILEEHIRAQMPAGTRVEFDHAHISPAYYLDPDHPLVEKTLSAIRQGFDTKALLTREGGSIPIVVDIAARTGSPVLLVGLGQITDNWHGPNERFSLRDFHRGMRTSAALLHELGKVS
ncbi:MAG: acetylornithine deacetylase/succinyl-diaminopimelate desuccinylase-like protein [Candidatus Latescibacterota bacterium]|jgi:acetylornithine deacetylase/succinyl-diaminopimelate desuccinylase-like protein